MPFLQHLRLSLLLALVPTASIPGAEESSLAGTWQFNAERSTELSPWRGFELTIRIEGDRITIERQLGAGRRGFKDSMTLSLSAPVNVIPVELWPDNRHLGAYIGGDRTKKVQASWLEAQRILRLNTDVVLSTQQGDRPVNTLSDYKLSANGAQLTLTELRSTRLRPVVYVFTRKPAPNS